MSEPNQRRNSPRNEHICLANFRQPDAGLGDPERLCVTKDYSHNGIYFLADNHALREGMRLLMRFPYNSHPAVKDREFLVEVKRINALLQGRCGVGAKLVLHVPVKPHGSIFAPEMGLSKHAWPHAAAQYIDLYA